MMFAKRFCATVIASMLALYSLSAIAGGVEHRGKLGRHASKDHLHNRNQQEFQLQPFYAIIANGRLDLFIHGSKPYSSVVLRNYQALREHGKRTQQPIPLLWVDNGVLYIDNENWLPDSQTMRVDINVKDLNGLFLTGNVMVVGDHIISNGMAIDDGSDRNVSLGGVMTLNWLDVHGKGDAKIGWVEGRRLLMAGSGAGRVQLAGSVHNMHVRLSNTQHYRGEYLRTDNLLVLTRDDSQANVFARNSEQNFAYDMSNILYFHTPNSLNRMMKGSANVLQADWRP